MKKIKMEQYNQIGSIHTATIVTTKTDINTDDLPEEIQNCINAISTSGNITKIIINPNKLNGDIFTFSGFKNAMDIITGENGLNLEEYYFRRVDFRFDSYDPDFFESYEKLHRYIVALIAVTYKTRNQIESIDLFDLDLKTIVAKNDYFEIEYYNRDLKNKETGNTTEPAKARLELRAKAKNISPGWTMNDLKDVFLSVWISRLEKSIMNRDLVYQRFNDTLERRYFKDKQKPQKIYRDLTDFLVKHQDRIFDRKQMIALLDRFPEVHDPSTRADWHKKKWKPEYYSMGNLQSAILEIKKSMKQFFRS